MAAVEDPANESDNARKLARSDARCCWMARCLRPREKEAGLGENQMLRRKSPTGRFTQKTPVGPQTPTTRSGKKGVGVWVWNTFVDPLDRGRGWVAGPTEVPSYQCRSLLSLPRILGTPSCCMVHIQGSAREIRRRMYPRHTSYSQGRHYLTCGTLAGHILLSVVEAGVFIRNSHSQAGRHPSLAGQVASIAKPWKTRSHGHEGLAHSGGSKTGETIIRLGVK